MTDPREEMTEWRNFAGYVLKVARIHLWNLTQWVNRHTLKTYPLIEECARCRDCGRNVHDFLVPPKLWDEVIGAEGGVWCYDCFANRADEKLGFKWRLDLREFWFKDGPLKEGDPCPICNGERCCPVCGAVCIACAGFGECDGYLADEPAPYWKCECGVSNSDTFLMCPGCGAEKP